MTLRDMKICMYFRRSSSKLKLRERDNIMLMMGRYLLSDIRMLQEHFKPSKTNDGDCEYVPRVLRP